MAMLMLQRDNSFAIAETREQRRRAYRAIFSRAYSQWRVYARQGRSDAGHAPRVRRSAERQAWRYWQLVRYIARRALRESQLTLTAQVDA